MSESAAVHTSDDRRVGVCRVAREFLVSLLQLPGNTVIESVFEDKLFLRGHLVFRLQHPSFPIIGEGEYIHEIEPVYCGAEQSCEIQDFMNAHPEMPAALRVLGERAIGQFIGFSVPGQPDPKTPWRIAEEAKEAADKEKVRRAFEQTQRLVADGVCGIVFDGQRDFNGDQIDPTGVDLSQCQQDVTISEDGTALYGKIEVAFEPGVTKTVELAAYELPPFGVPAATPQEPEHKINFREFL